jgi:hypothetical protein
MGRAGGQWSRCAAHLRSCRRDTLVESSSSLLLSPARVERGGGSREGAYGGGDGRREEAQRLDSWRERRG